jgi:hypothetical protein
MTAKHNFPNDWQPCRPGEVVGLVQRLRQSRQALVVRYRAATAALVLLAGAAGLYFVGVLPAGEPNFGGIVCSEVQRRAADFLTGRLEADVAARIRVHLSQCADCNRFVNGIDPQAVPPGGPCILPPCPPAACPGCPARPCGQRRFPQEAGDRLAEVQCGDAVSNGCGPTGRSPWALAIRHAESHMP